MDCRHTVQEMTRDCRHSTGDDQRLRTQYREMTRDCGHSTGDDQRLRTFGREGERVPEFDRYPLPLPRSCPSLFFSRAGFCDSRVPTAHAREALRFVNGWAPTG
ncbi:unnamed protein product, partial [Staurois parvus]